MKEYVKPELYCESFELSQHIAACGIDVNHGDTAYCTPTLDPGFWGGMSDTVFSDGRADCSMDISAIDVYCYTVGTSEAGRTFNS
ncbi:MAG: hypothetical protein PUJ12_01875 [Oscillospiraceae bacterium]|uniref:hypothetical protein n=1 Tax=Evtepia sp. TaxID=2773933 RepID=UPI002A80D331|nr:hypothetical protein [Evtepia sp.]MDD7673524.1 hypothetical protein [Oscillospiraceae bacterium]MDY4430456.1 hypothetical protein [Evtepia sp.]